MHPQVVPGVLVPKLGVGLGGTGGTGGTDGGGGDRVAAVVHASLGEAFGMQAFAQDHVQAALRGMLRRYVISPQSPSLPICMHPTTCRPPSAACFAGMTSRDPTRDLNVIPPNLSPLVSP